MIDLLSYMLPDQVWALSKHLAVNGGGQPILTIVIGNQIWYMKGQSGSPWDMFTFDQNYVYQSITENVWTDPHTFKMFASKSWPGANGGVAWCPRFLPNDPVPLMTADSTYRVYTACNQFTTATLGGPIMTRAWFDDFDAGGSLGQLFHCLIVDYHWNPGLTVMERNIYSQGKGLVSWATYNLIGGVYVQQKESLFDMELAGGSPPVNFPCGVPVV
jgi:hypothetical protein